MEKIYLLYLHMKLIAIMLRIHTEQNPKPPLTR